MKKIGILGSGMVANSIATKLIQLGYQVKMGARSSDNSKNLEWKNNNGNNAFTGTFHDAASFGDILFICIKGEAVVDVIKSINRNFFNAKLIIDVSNPLDFSKGMPPSMIPNLSNFNSLGEELQKAIPDAYVVKTLNIVNCEVMVNPAKTNGIPTMFLCGNNETAKKHATDFLKQFGWTDIIDLGDISGARGMEMILPLWIRTMLTLNYPYFAFKVVK